MIPGKLRKTGPERSLSGDERGVILRRRTLPLTGTAWSSCGSIPTSISTSPWLTRPTAEAQPTPPHTHTHTHTHTHGLRGGSADFEERNRSRFGGWFDRYHISGADGRRLGREDPKTTQGADIRHWDVAPPQKYFDELARVSKNQIIWGGNYFDLPPTRCFLVWRKLSISENFTMAMAEYAWTSFNDNAKVFEAAPQGNTEKRIHPTQKPVALYAWIFSRYAKPGDKILDTHLGSGSSRIAAWDAGLDFVGCEIDKVYFDLAEARFQRHAAQGNLFLDEV